MKPAVTRALAVGSLVAVTGIAFLIAFTFFKKGGYSKSDSYLVSARFSDATGLTWKSRVQIAGIQVGEVERIDLVGDKALLSIRIRNDVLLHTDACLYKTFPSALLPDALLEVSPGSSPAPSLKAEPEDRREITCIREATSVQQLLDSMSKIANDVSLVTGDLADTVRGNQGSLKNVIENLAATTGRLREIVDANDQTVSQILANTRDFTRDLRDISGRDKERVHQILVNVQGLTADLRTTAQSLERILGTGGGRARGTSGEGGEAVAEVVPARGTDETAPGGGEAAGDRSGPGGPVQAAEQVKGVQQAVEKLNDNLDKLDEILGKVKEGKSVAGRLLVDERLGRQVGNTVEGLSDYFDRLNRLQVQLHLRSEALLNQSVSEGRPGAKVYFGARIIPRPDKYYEFEVVSDPRGVDTVTTDTYNVTRCPNSTSACAPSSGNTDTTVVFRNRNEQKLAFSLQMAKRYGPLNLRGGVIESSGGLGADLYLLRDSLRFSLSVFQFNRPNKEAFPRAKLWADYVFLKHLYVTTGVDDFLNRWSSSQRAGGRPFNIGTDVFFGAGVEFTDEDIKTLIGSGVGTVGASAAK